MSLRFLRRHLPHVFLLTRIDLHEVDFPEQLTVDKAMGDITAPLSQMLLLTDTRR